MLVNKVDALKNKTNNNKNNNNKKSLIGQSRYTSPQEKFILFSLESIVTLLQVAT